jgi:hypothetical protein
MSKWIELRYWRWRNRAVKHWPFRKSLQSRVVEVWGKRDIPFNIRGTDEDYIDTWSVASAQAWEASKEVWIDNVRVA